MPSLSTIYTCSTCGESSNVEVTDLNDPYQFIPGQSQEALRRIRSQENVLVHDEPIDPVDKLAQDLLTQEARRQLRYARCPKCATKNPEGIAADKKDRQTTLLFGVVFFGIIALIARFFPWAALIIPGMDLLVFRPIMFVQGRKNKDKPFPVLRFMAGIVMDILLIVVILIWPAFAPIIPILGIVQSLFTGSSKSEWRWQEAESKLQFQIAGS